MNLRTLEIRALLLAGLVLGLPSLAGAQSTNGTQKIVFSAPDGQIMSNAPLPMAQAPDPREMPALPAANGVISEFSSPPAGPEFPPPPQMLEPDSAQIQNDFRDPMGVRKQMSQLTAAQIMNLPSVEQIFGLAENVGPQKPAATPGNAGTNDPAFDTMAIVTEPRWARLWSGDIGNRPGPSNPTARASGFFSGLFDASRNDSSFGNQGASDNGMIPDAPQSVAQSSPWDSPDPIVGDLKGPSTSMTPVLTTPIGSSPGFSALSPFADPPVSSLDTLPKLPSLPSLPGRNTTLGQLPTPSWAPKAPPWEQAQTPLGTPLPPNLSR
ncbi:MAG: hypothetical protein ACRED1_14385 [Limisphaerales bacterium]